MEKTMHSQIEIVPAAECKTGRANAPAFAKEEGNTTKAKVVDDKMHLQNEQSGNSKIILLKNAAEEQPINNSNKTMTGLHSQFNETGKHDFLQHSRAQLFACTSSFKLTGNASVLCAALKLQWRRRPAEVLTSLPPPAINQSAII